MSTIAYVALGSNLGDRESNIEQALEKLRKHSSITVNEVSSIYETEPEGGPANQEDYLNAAVEIETDLEAPELLHALLEIEEQLGRVRGEPNLPRTIDLDLLLYGDEIIDEPGLELPHPRMHLRSFVLEPLDEIATDVVHPKLKQTIGDLWDDFDPDAVVAESEEEESIREVSPVVAKTQSLLGQRVLVTGSTSGIGRAIALAFAGAGASVIIHGRQQKTAEEVADEAEALGVETGVIIADLYNLKDCQLIVETAWDDWGPIDVWVNNAGADILTGEAAEWSFSTKLQALMDVDVMATMMISRDVGRRMQVEGKGQILNIGWDKAEVGMEGDSGELFSAAKAAVMAFSKSLALTLAPHVRVNCLAPGWIRTAWGNDASDYWQKRVHRETPLERWGAPEEVAAAAVWLASPASSFITGQVIRINGGAVR